MFLKKYVFHLIMQAFQMKESVKSHLIQKNVSVIDLGPYEKKSVDYPDFAKKVANRVKLKK